MDRAVTASEANQHFSRLLREASSGESITITQRGRPVARLVPIATDAEAERAKRAEALRRWLADAAAQPRRSLPGWTRESLYERWPEDIE